MKKIINPTTIMAITFIMLLWVVTLFTSCSTPQNISKSKYKIDLYPSWTSVVWSDDIHNPDNLEYVNEVAFNLNISADSVTQVQFNARYEI